MRDRQKSPGDNRGSDQGRMGMRQTRPKTKYTSRRERRPYRPHTYAAWRNRRRYE